MTLENFMESYQVLYQPDQCACVAIKLNLIKAAIFGAQQAIQQD